LKWALAFAFIATSGLALSQSTTSTSPSLNPALGSSNKQEGLAKSLISSTGANTASSIGASIGSFAGGGGGGGFNVTDAGPVQRFALPGQGGTGLAAAPGDKVWNAWASVARSSIAYNFQPLQSSGNVDVLIVGVDRTLDNKVIVGLAIAGDSTSVNTQFNGGNMSGRGTTYSPYVAVPLNRNWTADATVGWGQTTVKTNALGVSGENKVDRTMGNVGVTYRALVNQWMFTGRGAYLSVNDNLGAYTMSNGQFVADGTVRISQMRFGGQATYNAGSVFPYVGATYIYDLKAPNQAAVNGVSAANDRDGVQGVLGLQFKSAGALYGGIQYSSEMSRKQIKNDQLQLNIGAKF